MKLLSKLLASGALLLTAACADHYTYAGYDTSRGYGYTGSGGHYDGYYDGYYGPFSRGYWRGSTFYFYRPITGRWYRDNSRHFRRAPGVGYSPFRVSGRGSTGRVSGRR